MTAANTAALGIGLTDEVQTGIRVVLAEHRRRQRTRGAIATGAIAIALVGAVVAVLARNAARSNERAAAAQNRYQRSLSTAASSLSNGQGDSALRIAEHAIALNRNPTTIDSLRSALATLFSGDRLNVSWPGVPIAAAIDNDGSRIIVAVSGGALVLTQLGASDRQTIIPATQAQAGDRVAITPDGRYAAVVRSDDKSIEFVRTADGRLGAAISVPAIADLAFDGSTRLILVQRNGEVRSVTPSLTSLHSRLVGSTGSRTVRAAAITSTGMNATFTIATLSDDARVRLTKMPGQRSSWSAPLAPGAEVKPLKLGPYEPGQDFVRVCGHSLAVVTTAQAGSSGPAFGVPFTVSENGTAANRGSFIRSFGVICLPDGTSLAYSQLEGQVPFPHTGATLGNFANGTGDHVMYAIASSANDQWGVAAGTDGTLQIDRLANAARVMSIATALGIAPDGRAMVIITGRGRLERVVPGAQLHNIPAPGLATGGLSGAPGSTGGPARGSFYNAAVGAVFADGDHVAVVDDGTRAHLITLPQDVIGIRPGPTPETAVAITASRSEGLLVPLSAGGPVTDIRFPPTVPPATVYDLVAVNRGEYALATTNGDVLFITATGRVLQTKNVGPGGRLVLAALPDHQLLAGTSDGVLHLLSANLKQLASRQVGTGTLMNLETDQPDHLVAAVGSADIAVAIRVPQLTVLAKIGPLNGLNTATIDPVTDHLLASTMIFDIGGGQSGSESAWPICTECSASVHDMITAGQKLLAAAPSDQTPRFVPKPRATHG